MELTVTEWLQNKFEAWRLQSGIRKTITEFASYIGIPEDRMLIYMNGSEVPKGSNLAKIAGMLGFGIYDLVKINTSEMLDLLPPLFRVRFASAFNEYYDYISEHKIDRESDEAREFLSEVFRKYKLIEYLG